MILEAIAGSLPFSVGVALSPLPIAAVIVMLMTARARANAPAFLVGWIVGILAVGCVVFVVPGIETARGDPTRLSGAIRVTLGIVLLLLSWRQWRQRPAPNEPVETPALLARLDTMGVPQSLGTGVLLSGVNPKNLLLVAAGAALIDASELAVQEQLVAFVVFTIIASLTVAVPVGGYFVARHRMESVLERWKDWLIQNNGTVLLVLMLIVGTVLISRGVRILAG